MMENTKHPICLFTSSEMSRFEAALFYLKNNISVLPLVGKKPMGFGWSEAMEQRVSPNAVRGWARGGMLMNVGIVCGAVSENLVVLDLDGVEAVETFSAAFPSLLETYQVLSGSGKGRHLYYYADDLPPTTRTKGYELRANGTYVVAPPSVHPDTKMTYQPMNTRGVSRVPDLAVLVEWINSRKIKPLAPLIPAPTVEHPAPHFITDIYTENGQRFYFNRALEGEIRRVTSSTEGERSNMLNKAAYCMGGLLVTAGDRGQVESGLLEAALSVGLSELESRRTIQSGLNAGMRKPRPFPKARGGNNA